MAASSHAHAVDEQQLRSLFNCHRFWERVQTGELTTEVKTSRHPSSPAAHVPACTRSQLLRYRDRDRRQVPVVYQYLLPDGQLGASDRPDPKWLSISDDVYILS